MTPGLTAVKRLGTPVLATAAGGVLAGILVGLGESLSLFLLSGVRDWATLMWAVAAYGTAGLLGGAGLGLGAGLLFGRRLPSHPNWWMLIGGAIILSSTGFVVIRFRLLRDLFQEQVLLLSPPSLSLHAVLIVVFGGLLVGALLLARRWRPSPAADERADRASLSRRTFLKVALTSGLAILPAATVASQYLGRASAAATVARRTGLSSALRQKPNIILIVADTLRADHVGAHGYAGARTANVDALAADGIRFAHAFTQASWTRPSIATLFTSLYPSSHGTIYKNSALPAGATTLAEVLTAEGYVTGGFGNNIHVTPLFNFSKGFTDFEFLAPTYLLGATEASSQLAAYQIARQMNERVFKRKSVHNFYQPADVVTGRAIEWIRARQDDRFFLFLHYMEPHDPYFEHPFNGYGIARVSTPNPALELAPELVRLYDGEIAYMDEHLGALFGWLKQQGLYDDTLVAFTADHGEEFGEHGGWWHGLTLYDEQLHVPLLLKLPRQAQAGTVDTALARTLDMAPTLLAAAGVSVPAHMQGMNLLGGESRPSLSFAETDHEGNVVHSLRGPEWKLIRANAGNPRGLPPLSLYHVAEDPGETRDMSAAETAKVTELSAHLGEALALAQAQAVAAVQTGLDEATLQQLRNLGY